MPDYREVTACRLCDSEQLVKALDLGQTPLANELDGTELFPLVVNRCEYCGHHQLSIAVSTERLWGPSYPYQSGTSPVFRKHLEALADEVAAISRPGCRVLEIASNDGTLVRLLADRGMNAVGVDPSGVAESGKGVMGVGDWTTATCSWPFKQYGPLKPEVILALNVFAHVDDLHSFTAAVKEALAPDGVFIFEVGYFADMCAAGVWDTIYHEHMSYHHVAPLRRFFERHGLKLYWGTYNDSQGGSIRGYVTHTDNPTLTIFPDDRLPDTSRLTKATERARAYLTEHTRSAKLICGYGAPAKLTTLAHTLDLPPVACIGEDNPLKVGRTTPGMHIPIVSVADMLAREPDCIIVFAWNFFEDIRDKLRRLGFAGDIINPMGVQ